LLQNLEGLSVCRVCLSDGIIEKLNCQRRLVKLEFSGELTERRIRLLKRFPALEELSVEGVQVSPEIANEAFCELPQLHVLKSKPEVHDKKIEDRFNTLYSKTLLDFGERTLAEMCEYTSDVTHRDIMLDPDDSIDRESLITAESVKGSLVECLQRVLHPTKLEAVSVPNGILITTSDKAQRMTSRFSHVTWQQANGNITVERGLRIILSDSPSDHQ
jgi:hypothetical protein